MAGLPSPFGGGDDEPDDNGGLFNSYDEFETAHLPEPGEFLDGHDVLTGPDHVAFHRLTRDLFGERTVYDMTFNYNLARLNLDTRHPGAGYRYANELETDGILRAEFTPTTPFCPQTHTLTIGSFRAWNGLRDRHDYELVRVRAASMHHQSQLINQQLEALETEFERTGTVPDGSMGGDALGSNPMERAKRAERQSRGPDAPF